MFNDHQLFQVPIISTAMLCSPPLKLLFQGKGEYFFLKVFKKTFRKKKEKKLLILDMCAKRDKGVAYLRFKGFLLGDGN